MLTIIKQTGTLKIRFLVSTNNTDNNWPCATVRRRSCRFTNTRQQLKHYNNSCHQIAASFSKSTDIVSGKAWGRNQCHSSDCKQDWTKFNLNKIQQQSKTIRNTGVLQPKDDFSFKEPNSPKNWNRPLDIPSFSAKGQNWCSIKYSTEGISNYTFRLL